MGLLIVCLEPTQQESILDSQLPPQWALLLMSCTVKHYLANSDSNLKKRYFCKWQEKVVLECKGLGFVLLGSSRTQIQGHSNVQSQGGVGGCLEIGPCSPVKGPMVQALVSTRLALSNTMRISASGRSAKGLLVCLSILLSSSNYP